MYSQYESAWALKAKMVDARHYCLLATCHCGRSLYGYDLFCPACGQRNIYERREDLARMNKILAQHFQCQVTLNSFCAAGHPGKEEASIHMEDLSQNRFCPLCGTLVLNNVL